MLRYKAKITRVEDFFYKKQMIKYFEMSILALNWNYQYLKKFNLKGSEPESVEALRIYNAVLAVRYTGRYINANIPRLLYLSYKPPGLRDHP